MQFGEETEADVLIAAHRQGWSLTILFLYQKEAQILQEIFSCYAKNATERKVIRYCRYISLYIEDENFNRSIFVIRGAKEKK